MTYLHISYSALEDCINEESYGEICVKCNACGRWDKSTQKESALKIYKRQLQEQYGFNNWISGMEEIQKKNIKANIKYYKQKIAELGEIDES